MVNHSAILPGNKVMAYFRVLILSLVVIATLPWQAAQAGATTERNQPVRLFLDEFTQSKGFTLTSEDHQLSLGVPPNSLPVRDRIRVTLKRPNIIPKQIRKNSDEHRFSHIYSFDVFHSDTIWPTTPLWIKVHYLEEANTPLSLAYWDSSTQTWTILPSTQDKTNQTVSATVHLPYALITVLEAPRPAVVESGTASWYNFGYAAHRTLPFGTQVKVTNIQNGKSVVVEVKDRGPFIEGRVIDLPRSAFEQIASLGTGVIPVTLQLVNP